jgi:hypothetical protein
VITDQINPSRRIPNPTNIAYALHRAVVVVGGVAVQPCAETTTMILIIGIVLSFVGLAYLCWLLFTLAVYALPLFVGASMALAAYHGGSGPIAATIVGLIASSITVVTGQLIATRVHSPLIRAAIALVFAVPAGVAGYHAALGLAQLGVPAEAWRHVMALIGSIAVAATAWARIALIAPPDTGGASLPASAVRLTSVAHDG